MPSPFCLGKRVFLESPQAIMSTELIVIESAGTLWASRQFSRRSPERSAHFGEWRRTMSDTSDAKKTDPAQTIELSIERIREALAALRFGTIALTVHEGRVVQIDITEKTRF